MDFVEQTVQESDIHLAPPLITLDVLMVDVLIYKLNVHQRDVQEINHICVLMVHVREV